VDYFLIAEVRWRRRSCSGDWRSRRLFISMWRQWQEARTGHVTDVWRPS